MEQVGLSDGTDSSQVSTSRCSTAQRTSTTADSLPADSNKAVAQLNHGNPSKQHSSLADWIPELVSLTLSILSLAATIGLVSSQHNRPLRNVFGAVTLNAAVAILTSAFKASMIMPVAEVISELKWLWFASGSQKLKDMEEYDRASRGPRGSLQLLFWQFPKNKLACLAAAITILSLGTDAVTQSIVQTYPCLVDSDWPTSTANILRTNNYSHFDNDGTNVLGFTLDAPMSLALFEGIFAAPANSSAQLPKECRSGFCTFPRDQVYSTVAMCSSVQNISNRIVKSSGGGPNEYTLVNSNVSLRYHESDFSVGEVDQNLLPRSANTPLFQFELLGTISGEQPHREAFSVSLYPCVKTFGSVRIVNSQVHQIELSSTPLARIGSNETVISTHLPTYYTLAGDISIDPAIDCTPVNSKEQLKSVPANRLGDGRYYVVRQESELEIRFRERWTWNDDDVVGREAGPQTTVYFDPACTWTFGIGATTALNRRMQELFGTQQTPQTYNTYLTKTGDFWIGLFYDDLQSRRVQNYVDGIVDSINVAIRSSGDFFNSQPFEGIEQVSDTCVRFGWQFLIWNVVLLIAACFVLAMALLKSARMARAGSIGRNRRPWKSSALAMVWCELDTASSGQRNAVDTVKQMKQQALSMEARLVDRITPTPSFVVPSESFETSASTTATQGDRATLSSVNVRRRWILAAMDSSESSQKRKARRWGGFGSKYLPI